MWTPALGVIIGATRSSASLTQAPGRLSTDGHHQEQRSTAHAPSHGVNKRSGGIDDDACVNRKLLPRQLVAAQRTPHTAFGILRGDAPGVSSSPPLMRDEQRRGVPL